MNNIITVKIMQPNGVNMTPFRYRYDYGQILKIEGIDLPEAYEVHFANQATGGTTVTQIGNADGVTVPDALFLTGSDIFVFLFLHTGNDDGETVIKIQIPVKDRPQPSDDIPSPVEQSAITQAIAALNQAVEETSQSASDAAESASQAEASAVQAAGYAEEAGGAASDASQYADLAYQHATQSGTSAEQAAESAENASASAQASANSAAEAHQSELNAEDAADRAEQFAAESGYMFFYIDENGDLIYQRTNNVDVDFYLNQGDLYVKAVN